MPDTTSEVTAAAPAAAEASPAPASADLGGSQGAPSGGAPASPGTDPAAVAAAPVAESESSVDADAGELPEGLTPEDLQQVPDQWRGRFDSLLTGYKGLEKDVREWKALGERETVQSGLQLLDGLYGQATDEQGNILYDQETGLPVPSTVGFLSKIEETSPALASQLFLDQWSMRGRDGMTGAQRMFRTLGLDPSRLEDYRALTQNPSKQVATTNGVISADELANVPETDHDIYKQLTVSERYRAQQMDDQELKDFLADKREQFDNRQFRDEFNKAQAEQATQQQQQFWQGVDKSFEDYSTRLRQDGLNSIVKSLTTQVQFSSDPVTNVVQTGAVMSIVANLLNADLRFASQDILQNLGVTLDQGFYDSLDALGQQAYVFKKYEAIAGNPALAQFRNDAAMAKAQSEVNRLYTGVMAKFNTIALKVAKVIAGGNQELREVEKSNLQVPARPGVGRGALPGSGGNGAITAKPFTVEYLQQSQQQRAG